MAALAVLAFLVSLLSVQGARLVKRRGTVVQTPVGRDVVDAIFTFGAPPVGSPALVNHRTQSGCFNGLRIYQSKAADFFGKYTDLVAFTNPAGYRHPMMAAREVYMNKKPDYYVSHECSDGVTAVPFLDPVPWRQNGTPNVNMHFAATYLQTVMKLGNRSLEDLAVFGLEVSYMDDVAQVAKLSRERGWKLVGNAADMSLGFTHGPQVSHLLQKPETLECVITFEGTDPKNGQADRDANEENDVEKFCGLVDEDEAPCGSYDGTCVVKRQGDSFVHRGFANRARSVALSEGWNRTIRKNLPACSKVSVVGHSAGGAVAELVAACLSKQLAPNDFGYDDRSLFGWIPTTWGKELPEFVG